MNARAAPGPAGDGPAWLVPLLLAVAVALIASQAWIALVRQFNWDEYLFLAKIYRQASGDLTSPFQTFYVHLFGWLTHVGEVHDELIAGRMVMVACQAVTGGAIYLIARRWTGRVAALIAVIAYLGCGTTLAQGASFRADPLAGALSMAALAVVARAPLRTGAVFAATLLAGIAILVTLKSVFYVPVWLVFGLWRLRGEGRPWLDPAAIAGVVLAGLTIGALFAVHVASLGTADIVAGSASMESAGDKVLFDAGLLPQANRILYVALTALPQTALLLLSLALLVADKVKRRGAADFWLLLACASPLLSLLFYRNAYLYFFPFIMPSSMVLIGWLIERLRYDGRLLFGAIVAISGTALVGTMNALTPGQEAQRQVLDEVHAIFPAPVYAIDRNHMIADYPRDMIFMSTWGLENYRKDRPFAAEYLGSHTVPLLLLNSPILEEAAGIDVPTRPEHRLFQADKRILRENYIPHWGPVWVAGKRFAPSAEEQEFEILVPGTYTLEETRATVDGTAVALGEAIVLKRGIHRLKTHPARGAVLRWGRHLHRPAGSPPAAPLYAPGGEV